MAYSWLMLSFGILFGCVLWSALADGAHQYHHLEEVKATMLRKLALTEAPHLVKRDLEKAVVPARVRNKYISMLKLYKDKERKRRALPSLAGILRGVPGNSDTRGDVLYSDPARQTLVFDMKGLIPENSEVTMAELKLFKKGVHKGELPLRRHSRPVNNARVSVHWVKTLPDGSNKTSLIDSRLVPILDSGWKMFDVTQAVHYWQNTKEIAMYLEVWIEAERPGRHAAELARFVSFTSQDPADQELGKPELVLYTLNFSEYGAAGDCSGSRTRRSGSCCRQEYFINFRELTWTQYWIIEPPGFQAFHCVGSCKQPQWPFDYGERSCAAVESASLPVMYLVKKGDYTEIEVAEFPNMITEKCGCTMDNISMK
ncbi:left-right determination factor 2-like [Stegostoma tigrinum]|uniref:left-right determination factor 2-like n=1 Tax=Stegostoma tigrinum TaxID=3053191 RepID=UPI00286FC7BF|nr:left-right determination factor 2-like [Stegostoma tigrinum]